MISFRIGRFCKTCFCLVHNHSLTMYSREFGYYNQFRYPPKYKFLFGRGLCFFGVLNLFADVMAKHIMSCVFIKTLSILFFKTKKYSIPKSVYEEVWVKQRMGGGHFSSRIFPTSLTNPVWGKERACKQTVFMLRIVHTCTSQTIIENVNQLCFISFIRKTHRV